MFGLKFGNEITALEILAKFLRSNNAKTDGESVQQGALEQISTTADIITMFVSLKSA